MLHSLALVKFSSSNTEVNQFDKLPCKGSLTDHDMFDDIMFSPNGGWATQATYTNVLGW